MKFLVHKDGKQIGPFTATQIDEYLNKGILCPMDHGWHEGLNQWVELHELDGVGCREISEQEAMDILEQQTMESQEAPPDSGGDATGGLIPYKNKHALVGYYMSIGGLLLMCVPVLGLGYGIAVLYCGIKGRKNAKEHPEVKGSVHAWIAIIGGVVEILVGAFTTFILIVSLLESM